jgi:hypothetical protein
MAIWLDIACWISKVTPAKAHAGARASTSTHTHTHTHTQKYIKLFAFPREQWFRERALMFRDTYTACLVNH